MVSERMFRYEIGMKSGESPNLGGIPIVMTSHSRRHVIISPKNENARDFSHDLLCNAQEEEGRPS